MTRLLLALALLAATYLLALGSLSPWDVALGLALSGALLLYFRRFLPVVEGPPAGRLLARALWLPPFAVVLLREVLVGTWQVAVIALRLRHRAPPGIVAVPIGERSPVGVVVTSLFITLSPGTVVVAIDEARGVLLVHLLEADAPERFRERMARIYARWQRRVFP